MALLTQTRTERATFASALLSWRTEYNFGVVERIAFAAFCSVLAITIPFHEPWGDEAQAWLIARDSTTWDILRHRLHYEGAPPLWHLILHCFHLIGGTYGGMNWLGGVFATAGVFVLLRWSPFPILLRVLLPFTFFLQYQYAVVARGYTLFPLLVFTLCTLFPRRNRAIAFACVAGLLANLSFQGVIFSAIAIALYAWEHLRHNSSTRWQVDRCRGLRTAALVYVILLLVASVVGVPAPDGSFRAVPEQVASGPVHQLLVPLIGQPAPRLIFLPQPVTPELPRPKVDFLKSPGDWAIWYITCDESDSACPRGQSVAKSFLSDVLNAISQITWPVSTSKVLACLFLVALAFWLHAMRGLRFLLFGAALITSGQIIWSVDHHAGMFFISLLAAVWLAQSSGTAPQTSPRFGDAFLSILLLIVTLQIGWTVYCVRGDVWNPYDPGRSAAAYMKQHPVRRAAAFQYFSCSIQPYFKHNPFFNLPSSYWRWSTIDNPDAHFRETIATHPDLVVFSTDVVRPGMMENEWAPMVEGLSPEEERTFSRNPIVQDLHANGYRETRRFCGSRFMRLGISMGVCDVFFETDADMHGQPREGPR